MADTQQDNIKYYNPTFLDAVKVYWSYTWRSTIIGILISIPVVIVTVIVISTTGDVEAGIKAYQQQIAAGSIPLPLAFASLGLRMVAGYLALRDLVKAKYKNFTFDQAQVTPRHMLILTAALNIFSISFSFFAAPTGVDASSLSVFLFITIELIVSFAIIQHFLSAGFLGGRLGLLPRGDER